MSHTATLHNWAEAHAWLTKLAVWVKAHTTQGKAVVVTAARPPRTSPQNRLIHPLVQEIAVKAGRPTDKASLDELRWLLVEAWRHETRRPSHYARSLDGLRMVDVSNRTSALDKAEAAEFLDWLIAWEAQA
jgi:hypothetical protein